MIPGVNLILPAAEVITRKVNTVLLPAVREIVTSLSTYGSEWSANEVMADVAAAEAQVDAQNGEVAVYGGYDTNHVRIWNAVFSALGVFLNTPVNVTLANGQILSITPLAAVLKYYSPVEAR